jgi:hypothetical protein
MTKRRGPVPEPPGRRMGIPAADPRVGEGTSPKPHNGQPPAPVARTLVRSQQPTKDPP